MNLETEKHTKGIEIHQSQITNQDRRSKLLFPKRSAEMIDCSKKHKHQLACFNYTVGRKKLLLN